MHDELLRRHLELVIEANKTTNITRIDSLDEGMVLHVEDSLIGLPEVKSAPPGPLVDIGSGAGYPGIPLAIESGRETLLVDSVGKKALILESIVKELSMENIQVYTGRIETLSKEMPSAFSVATARALAKLPVLMELASPLLQEGGRLICYKANVASEEYDHALKLQKKLAMKLTSERKVMLGDKHRCIISFKKIGLPLIKLPRKTGMAQKRPL